MKVGIYGGTFDPIHIAHLIIAEHARCQFSLDRVVFVPCFIPPHKRDRTISSANHRMHMVQLAVGDYLPFSVSDFEIERPGASYTVDTLEHFALTLGLGKEQLYLIIGADNFSDFDQWREPERIVRLATLAVAERPGCRVRQPESVHGAAVHSLHAPLMQISATQIRQRVREGRSIRYLTPAAVEEYIHVNRLYQLSEDPER